MAKNEFESFLNEADVEYMNEFTQGNYGQDFKVFETKLNNIKQQTKDQLFNILFTQQSRNHQQDMLDLQIKNIEQLIEDANSIRKKLDNIFTNLDTQGNYKEDLTEIKNDFITINEKIVSLKINLDTDIQKLKSIKQYI